MDFSVQVGRMKILLVHNDYGKYSGEEAVVDKMRDIFISLGHEVAQLRMSTAQARESLGGKIRVFTAGIHSPSGVRAMREALERERPDLVNVHNVYPFISPAALRECKKAGVPVVMTIHNFRLICPTGLFMRRGVPCELCLEKGHEWGCIIHNCENSYPKSVAYAARNALARKKRHFIDCVDRFACITDFQRQKLIAAGFAPDKITVIPNPMDTDPLQSSPASGLSQGDSKGYVAFCGRLSHEKGIDLILDTARRHPEISFRLAGAVADPELVSYIPSNVELTGYLSGEDLNNFYRNSRFVVMASRCYEGFPMAILEAAKFSRPTIGPNHGGFSEIIKPSLHNSTSDLAYESLPMGLLFTPGDASSLEEAIVRLWQNPDDAEKLGNNANLRLRRQYSTQVVAQQWSSLLSSLVTKQLTN